MTGCEDSLLKGSVFQVGGQHVLLCLFLPARLTLCVLPAEKLGELGNLLLIFFNAHWGFACMAV